MNLTNSEKRLYEILAVLYEKDGCEKSEAEKLSYNAIEYMNSGKSLLKDIKIRLVKGGTYKIKGYYLENNELSDIRGASTIITKVQDDIIPKLLISLTGFDCILYNGGGNLFAVVPENTDTALGTALEKEAQKYLITANSAYIVSEPLLISELLGKNYSTFIAEKENELNIRKKLKINVSVSPSSEFIGEELFDGIVIKAEENSEHKYCEKCKKRIARYKYPKSNLHICGGCLHKYRVGVKQKKTYSDEYRNFLPQNSNIAVAPVYSFTDISKDKIAVIYADGNNMGGIIRNFTKLTDMIDFSSFVKTAVPEIVYGSMEKCGIGKFEIVAMGGDDIFMIVPGKKAVQLSAELVKEYNRRFGEKYGNGVSTLSVGACIAKTKTPVKVMLEAAEEELSRAKDKVKTEGCDGSLSYVIFNTFGGNTDYSEGMLPFTVEQAEEILDYIGKTKVANSKFQNIAEAYENAECYEEANLFLEYMNAKEAGKKNPVIVQLPKLSGYTLNGGCYEKDGRIYTIWNELLDLINIIKEND